MNVGEFWCILRMVKKSNFAYSCCIFGWFWWKARKKSNSAHKTRGLKTHLSHQKCAKTHLRLTGIKKIFREGTGWTPPTLKPWLRPWYKFKNDDILKRLLIHFLSRNTNSNFLPGQILCFEYVIAIKKKLLVFNRNLVQWSGGH